MAAKDALTVKIDLQGFVFETGKEFRGMTISQKGDSWNFVLRATDADGTAVYCIEQHEDIGKAFTGLWEAVCSKDAKYFWRLDGWA